MRNKVVIVMPTMAGRGEALTRHFAALRVQTFQQFDIVLAVDKKKPLDLIPESGFETVVAENDIGGAAGGFYSGQKKAYELGYEIIIYADDDCVPVSETLVGNIVKSLEDGAEAVFAEGKLGDWGLKNYNAAFYCGMTRDAVEKIGFMNPLFYRGGFDREYNLRINRSLKTARISDAAFHPYSPDVMLNRELAGAYYSIRAQMLMLYGGDYGPLRTLYYLITPFLYLALFRINGKSCVADAIEKGIGDGLAMRTGVRNEFSGTLDDEYAVREVAGNAIFISEALDIDTGKIVGRNKLFTNPISSGKRRYITGFLSIAPRIFNREITLLSIDLFTGAIYATFAKSASAYGFGDKCSHLVFPYSIHPVVKVAMLALAMPLVAVSAAYGFARIVIGRKKFEEICEQYGVTPLGRRGAGFL